MQHILHLLLDDIPINHGIEGCFGIGTETTCVLEGSGSFVLFGVEHAGVVWAETHEEGVVGGGCDGVVCVEDHGLVRIVMLVDVV